MKHYVISYESGKTTTTGTPNEHTGKMSIAHFSKVFDSKSEREFFCKNNSEWEKVSIRKLRKLNLSKSLVEYKEYLEYLEYLAYVSNLTSRRSYAYK